MKCLSIQQPWAWAILAGHKRVENRTWSTRHRGPLAIHASMKVSREGYDVLRSLGIDVPDDLPGGVILGTVELVDVIDCRQPLLDFDGEQAKLAADPLATGPKCWILRNPRPLAQPIRHVGRLGLFDLLLEEPETCPSATSRPTRPPGGLA